MPTPTVINQYRFSDAINRRTWDNKYVFDQCNVNPVISKVGGGAAAGAGAEVDVIRTQFTQLEQFVIVGNTNLGPSLDTNITGIVGLNLASDTTATHGCEYDWGITSANPYTFKTNVDNAFFMKCEFGIAATGDTTVFIGFKKFSIRNATFNGTNYTDVAVIGLEGTNNHIKISTTSGGAALTTTDTTNTWANNAIHRLGVYVDATGVVSYKIDDAAPTVVPATAFQFAPNTVVAPFIRVLQGGTADADVVCDYLEFGFQS